MKQLKTLFAFISTFAFIALGFYLLDDQSLIGVIIGYSLIIFWSSLVIFAIYKKLTTKKINN